MNRKQVMKVAWGMAKIKANKLGGKASEYMSFALKKSWQLKKEYEAFKAPRKVAPDWIVRKNLISFEQSLWHNMDVVAKAETEKAVLFVIENQFGDVEMKLWCPKSVLVEYVPNLEEQQYFFNKRAEEFVA